MCDNIRFLSKLHLPESFTLFCSKTANFFKQMNFRKKSINLYEIAYQAMIEKGFLPTFSMEVQKEMAHILSPAIVEQGSSTKDLRHLLWFSIDNDDSQDLDQLTYAEANADGHATIYVAIADVDVLVKRDSAIYRHAAHNTTSVYTPTAVFSMLPEKLSTDFSSLNEDKDRLSMVVAMTITPRGVLKTYDVYPAYVRSHAKLAYNSITDWLEKRSSPPPALVRVKGLQEQIILHDQVAKLLMEERHRQGALTFEPMEFQPIVDKNGTVLGLQELKKNRTRHIIEAFMIAANTSVTKFLIEKKFPAIKRIVRAPKHWNRMVEIAGEFGETLPSEPDSKALEGFLVRAKVSHPLRFADLSLAIIKSLGRGEYVLSSSNSPSQEGHFALALQDYSHATAPNRRFLDLVLQTLLKDAIFGRSPSYTESELANFADYCTKKEVDAEKVERKVKKAAAAAVLANQIGSEFDAIATGASPKGTWVRTLNPPVEGKLVRGMENIKVGDKLRVRLLNVDIKKGHIDFGACLQT